MTLSHNEGREQDQIQDEADTIIKSITNCVERGEIEPGIKRGKCHVFLNRNNICQCEDIDLSGYSKMKLS